MSAPDPPSPTALVVAGDEETRVLLRGLLRLHHFRVVGEADGCDRAVGLVREFHPTILVSDVNLVEGSFASLLKQVKQIDPPPRVVLVSPGTRSGGDGEGDGVPDAVLYRPFRIRQFAEAIGRSPMT